MRALIAALLGSLLLAVTACADGNKAGGANGKRTIVLSFASQISGGQPGQLERFAQEVEARSGGAIRIEFKDNWRAGDLRQEPDMIADVKAGKVDLAWVGARAWDWLGVKSFEPLVAPLLIDSYPLERKVFEQRIPEQMLAATRTAGVVGIGVLPGPFRRVVGVRRPLLAPADFSGVRFGVTGMLAAQTMRALGARPRQVFAQPPLNGLGGIEEQMAAIVGNQHDAVARYLTANAALWPRPLVIFAGRRVFAKLTADQRSVLREAAAAAVPEALSASEQEDSEAVRSLCARGKMTLLDAKPGQLQALRAAVEPVYRGIERDAQAAATLRRIEALARAAPAPAPIRCRHGTSAAARPAATALDGTWQMTVDRGDLVGNPAYKANADYRGISGGPSDEDYRLDAGSYRLRIHGNRFNFLARGGFGVSRDVGTVRTNGHVIAFHMTGGHDLGDDDWHYRWSIFRGTLTFSTPPPGTNIGPPNPMFAPWHRLDR